MLPIDFCKRTTGRLIVWGRLKRLPPSDGPGHFFFRPGLIRIALDAAGFFAEAVGKVVFGTTGNRRKAV